MQLWFDTTLTQFWHFFSPELWHSLLQENFLWNIRTTMGPNSNYYSYYLTKENAWKVKVISLFFLQIRRESSLTFYSLVNLRPVKTKFKMDQMRKEATSDKVLFLIYVRFTDKEVSISYSIQRCCRRRKRFTSRRAIGCWLFVKWAINSSSGGIRGASTGWGTTSQSRRQ